MPSSRVLIRPLQIAAHPYNNSLVVLIHGILSNRYSAWEPAIDMIQEMYELGGATPTLGSFDYYAFGYQSRWQQPTFEEIFDSLRELLSRNRYDTVVLVGHSQGGVLAKLFLINELQNGRGHQTKVDVVITLDTPHRGPQPWIYPIVMIGGVWKRLPFLKRISLFRQASDLGVFSKNLRALRSGWTDTFFPTTPCAPEPQRRHLRSYTVCGTLLPVFRFKLVVSDRSAMGFDIDQPLEVPDVERRAWGLGHGVTAMMNYRLQIERLLSEHDFDANLTVRRELESVDCADLEPLLKGTCPSGSLASEADSWLRRLTRGLTQRPLRKLSAEQTVRKFVELRLGHP